MTKKLNSFKTYHDNGLSICIWMIIAYIMMLLPLCWGNWYMWDTQTQAESETETAWTSELREPWKLVEDELWLHQEMPPIDKDTPHERFKEMSLAYGLDPSKIWKVEDHYRLTEWVILCITIAETSWGNRWYGEKNIGSVGSNDRWDRPTYALMESWLEAIGKTLNNRYLGNIQTLGCLSNAGSCQEPRDTWKRYATSDWNWQRNMVACLSKIYGKIDPATFNIRDR